MRISSCSGESVIVLGSMGAVCTAPAEAGGAIPANGHVFGIRISHAGKGKSACLHTLEINAAYVHRAGDPVWHRGEAPMGNLRAVGQARRAGGVAIIRTPWKF
ncbi:hypothetical protein Aple_085100 [Acrocarpospora pleiomorpha]|uniref:Uncharacterized protein n=1 Tax=Acrocarpospora pleiomorpha TaxID=90975 RepID=A0A5M3Y1E1_9ACTN|nr:hypothetical protein Aple_085100 [Acrocarpospora pleiomorpha]